jgi:AcrR family transcriptional regulator
MPRTKQRTPELRDRLLQVAVAMLADEGVSGLTTRRVASEAHTSPPAVYELFGDKGGLVREVFFEGFRMLRRRFDSLVDTDDPLRDVVATIEVFAEFERENPVLAEVMFSRPFADFEPGPHELAAGSSVREFVVGRIARCTEAGLLSGDPTDIAHAVVALAQGLASQERAGWLGSSAASVHRRWEVAVSALLTGLRPARPIAAVRRVAR